MGGTSSPWGGRALEQADQGGRGVSLSEGIPNPPGRVNAAPVRGDPALTEGLTRLISRGLFPR